MNNIRPDKVRAHKFIESLLKLVPENEPDKTKRAELAQLRSYLHGDLMSYLRASSLVVDFLDESAYPMSDSHFFLVGSLFAYHPKHIDDSKRQPTLGRAFSILRRRRESKGIDSKGMDVRFLALLATGEENLQKPLFQAISLLKAEGIPLNYRRFLDDLLDWGHPDHYVQKTWARDYFRSEKSNDSQTNESETSSDEN